MIATAGNGRVVAARAALRRAVRRPIFVIQDWLARDAGYEI